MDDQLKELMKELGNAINASLSDSDRIAEAIGEIKRAGYDVFLVLEATIGFNKRDEREDDDEGDESAASSEYTRNAGATQSQYQQNNQPTDGNSRIHWTPQDNKFLKALKILVDDDKN